MAWRIGIAPPSTTCHPSFTFFSSSSSSSSSSSVSVSSVPFSYSRSSSIRVNCSYSFLSLRKRIQSTQLPLSSFTNHVCNAAEYKFPDPIPEFATAETEKFRDTLRQKLIKKDIYGDSLEEVLGICTEIFSEFLHTHYGGPGTLLVLPFIDMADSINERDLPGGPEAARAAVKWAQKFVDKDWKAWTGDSD